MKRILPCLAVAVGLLVACDHNTASDAADASGSSRPRLPPVATATTAPSSTTPVEPPTNERGNFVSALGAEEGMTDASLGGVTIVTFAIDAIAPVQCTDRFAADHPPENGYLVAADLRVATSPDLVRSSIASSFSINARDFAFVGPDGVTVTEIVTTATYA